MDKRLKQQLDFVLEIDKEKNILRQTHLSGHGRRENDAEHAWHMAIMTMLTPSPTTRKVARLKRPAKTLLKSVSSPSCRRIRKMSSSLSSTNLRTVKHLNPNMPMPWTIFNRFS